MSEYNRYRLMKNHGDIFVISFVMKMPFPFGIKITL